MNFFKKIKQHFKQKKIDKILEKHKKWLNNQEGGEYANLSENDLRRAYLQVADLRESNLHGADLREANLREANLRDADLHGANLQGAVLNEADLTGAKLPEFQITQDQTIVGYKKCYSFFGQYVVTLEIPAEAKRTANLVGNKCRCEFAKVIKIELINKNNELEEIKDENFEVRSIYNSDIKYQLNQMVEPDWYDDDIRIECTNGIHFFITKEEAINY